MAITARMNGQQPSNSNGKTVDPTKATVKPGKIFVRGLTADLTDDDIKAYFAQFGKIMEWDFPFDNTLNRRCDFCYVTYESEKTVNDLVKMTYHTILDTQVKILRVNYVYKLF